MTSYLGLKMVLIIFDQVISFNRQTCFKDTKTLFKTKDPNIAARVFFH
jgi:hypothetical protein